MADLECRCRGLSRDAECGNDATEEDGLCDTCRCEHGCCEDHGYPPMALMWELSVEEYADLGVAAFRRFRECPSKQVSI
jgi:hypothetical protein